MGVCLADVEHRLNELFQTARSLASPIARLGPVVRYGANSEPAVGPRPRLAQMSDWEPSADGNRRAVKAGALGADMRPKLPRD